MLKVGAGGRYSPALNCQNSRLASPVCEGRCTICVVIPAQPAIIACFRVSPQYPFTKKRKNDVALADASWATYTDNRCCR